MMAAQSAETSMDITSSAVRGTLWNYASFALSKGVTFISTIILARILAPEDFGLVAMGLVFINFLERLNELGVGHALIYQQGDLNRRSDAAFWVSISINFLLAVTALFAAPLASLFFHEPDVIPIIRALSVTFILSSLGSIHAARLKKKLDFRRVFLPQLGRTAAKGLVSIAMAVLGFGVWSLVAGQVAGILVSSVMFWIVVPWRPGFRFDISIARGLIGYGIQIISVSILGMVLMNIDYLLIGNRLGTEELGFYSMAFRLPELIILNICYVLSKALFPAYAVLQNDRSALQRGYISSLKYVSILTVPLAVGLFLLSEDVVLVFFSEKWSRAIPVMQMLSLYTLVYSIGFNAGDIYKGIGKPWILTVSTIMKIIILVPVIWYAAGISIYTVAFVQVAGHLLFTVLELGLVSLILDIKPGSLVDALLPALVGSAALFIAAGLALQALASADALVRLLIIPLTGVLAYGCVLWVFRREMVLEAASLLLAKRGKG